MNDLDELVELPHKDADIATPNVDHAKAHDPHVERICNCVERLNSRLGL